MIKVTKFVFKYVLICKWYLFYAAHMILWPISDITTLKYTVHYKNFTVTKE